MVSIAKYNLPMSCVVSMPQGAKIIKVAADGKDISIWAEVNAKAIHIPRQFVVLTNGESLPDLSVKYLDTILFPESGSAFHIYDAHR